MELADACHLQVGEIVPQKNLLIVVLRFFVLLAAFVSVSLYVSVDSNRATIKKFMQRSPFMRHQEGGTEVKMKVRTMALIDELGCISHVFSDKTGATTCRARVRFMAEFCKCAERFAESSRV